MIVVELTSSLDYAVPVALAILVAKTVADLIESEGIYDLVINSKALPFLDPKKEYRFKNMTVADVVSLTLQLLPHLFLLVKKVTKEMSNRSMFLSQS